MSAASGKRAPRLSSHAQCGVNPVVDPDLPFSLYALNQICAEATLLGENRRLAAGDAAMAAPGKEGERRGRMLVPPSVGYTNETCWEGCSATGLLEPFYFSLSETGQCFWCVGA